MLGAIKKSVSCLKLRPSLIPTPVPGLPDPNAKDHVQTIGERRAILHFFFASLQLLHPLARLPLFFAKVNLTLAAALFQHFGGPRWAPRWFGFSTMLFLLQRTATAVPPTFAS